MVERILGIDFGIASLGWSVVEHDQENTANNKIKREDRVVNEML